MAQFGHRCVREAELLEPDWAERPEVPAAALRAALIQKVRRAPPAGAGAAAAAAEGTARGEDIATVRAAQAAEVRAGGAHHRDGGRG